MCKLQRVPQYEEHASRAAQHATDINARIYMCMYIKYE